MSGLKSSRWFMFFQLYKQQKNSLAASIVCVGMCVCRETNPERNVQRAFLFHSSPSVRISPARNALQPPAASDGMEPLIAFTRESSSSPDAALEVTVWRPLYWAGGVTSFLLQSRLKSKGSQNTTAATSCQQTSGYNWKHTRSEAPSADAGLVEDKSSLRVQERDSNN